MPNVPWAPPTPDAPVQEGARWRYHKPSSEQVAAWFATVPLDDGMLHEQFVGGLVLIPQNEKVRYTRPDGGQMERYEQIYTPYVQIGTRVGYARRLAEHRDLIYHTEPARVPRTTNPASTYFNGNLPEGLWWHVVANDEGRVYRYLCATTRVGLYSPQTYAAKLRGEPVMPMLGGEGTKQVSGSPDQNMIARAQTGAIGRALGVAGILVVGTGVATAEDMWEVTGGPVAMAAGATLPPSEIAAGAPPEVLDEAEALDQLRSRALALQTQMQELGSETWRTFAAWYQERAKEGNWQQLDDVPFEDLKTVVSKLENDLAATPA
jgi:hypothetical protein